MSTLTTHNNNVVTIQIDPHHNFNTTEYQQLVAFLHLPLSQSLNLTLTELKDLYTRQSGDILTFPAHISTLPSIQHNIYMSLGDWMQFELATPTEPLYETIHILSISDYLLRNGLNTMSNFGRWLQKTYEITVYDLETPIRHDLLERFMLDAFSDYMTTIIKPFLKEVADHQLTIKLLTITTSETTQQIDLYFDHTSNKILITVN